MTDKIKSPLVRIGLAGITFGASPRKSNLNEAMHAVSVIVKSLYSEMEIVTWQVHWQPEMLQVSRAYFRNARNTAITDSTWFSLNALESFLLATRSAARQFMRDFFDGKHQREVRFRTAILSEKHLRLWKRALDDSLDWVIVLEDDALIDSDVLRVNLVQLADVFDRKTPVFVNLGGGNPVQTYQERWCPDVPKGWTAIPVADTSVAYAMNQGALELCSNRLERHHWAKNLGIDAFLSETFCLNPSVLVLVPKKRAISNGSLEGDMPGTRG